MRGRVAPILLAALACGCSSQADRQLEAVKSARSVLAEWALVEDQAASGRTPRTYAEQMRKLARDQLKTAETELAGQPQAAASIQRLRTGSPGAAALKSTNAALEPLEKRLESS
jgi:hypothetical protein